MGARSTSTSAHVVEQTHPRGWNSTQATRRKAGARGAGRSGGVDFRSCAAKKTMYGGVRLQRPYPAPLRSDNIIVTSAIICTSTLRNLYMYSLLIIQYVLFYRKDVLYGYVAIA
jgi:hypothetical protein